MYPIFVATKSYRQATYFIKGNSSEVIRNIPRDNIFNSIESIMGLNRNSIIIVLDDVDKDLLEYIEGKFEKRNILYMD